MYPAFSFILSWLQYSETTRFGLLQGAFVALIFLIATLLIRVLPRWKWAIAALSIIGITPLATLGFWYSTGDLGISDWDYYFSLHHGHVQTILKYHQLPFWNPYICGGTAGIADPEFRFFTPTFLLQLAFGVEKGLRLAIWLSIATGGVGMLLLAKKLGRSVYASLFTAIATTFSSVTIIEIVEGHPNVFAAMYIPWILWAWLAAYRARSARNVTAVRVWQVTTAVFLALTFFQGGIYLLMYTALAFLVFPFLVRNKRAAIWTTVVSGVFALGLAAAKLIPVFLWLSQFQDDAYANSAAILSSLHKIFLGRYLHGTENVIPNQGSGWHEYSAYVGPVALVVSLLGAISHWRNNRVVKALCVSIVLIVLLASSGPVLKPFFDSASWFPRSNISRVLLFAVISLSLLAGFGIDYLRGKLSKRVFAGSIFVIFLLLGADLFTQSYLLSEQAFVLPRSVSSLPPAQEPLQHSPFSYPTRYEGVDYSRAYTDILQGYGMMNYCSVLSPQKAVHLITDEVWPGTFQVEDDQTHEHGTYRVVSYTPNETVAEITGSLGATVTLNTNYADGWFINGQPARNIKNRVGTILEKSGTTTLIFRYKTPGFVVGLIISLITVIGCTLYLRRALGQK